MPEETLARAHDVPHPGQAWAGAVIMLRMLREAIGVRPAINGKFEKRFCYKVAHVIIMFLKTHLSNLDWVSPFSM